ncbi:MAG TPA: cyclic nucleotide-binding domain-containing protein [Verrucomicrobiales bacterium]|nr:cyclic nucleotide-binding domain-containing protein [Akkermansiaceae bacterium]HRX53912.1 cyclic nucleotide-binding domain-containing protein [Verrucomicrobiales bacterium]
MIHPNSRLREVWDIYIILVTVAAMVVVPLQLSLHQPVQGLIFVYEVVLSVSFALDIILRFRTGFFHENHLVMDPGRVAKRYLKTWFLLDLLAAWPLFLLHDKALATVVPLVRGLRILQAHRLIRIGRGNTFLRELHRRYSVNPGLFRLGYFVVLMMLAAHLLACGWIMLGGIQDEPDRTTKYVKAIYYTITTLATVGYGDITPQNNLQRLYAMGMMLVGVASYGYVIGNLATFLANRDIVRANFYKKLEEVTAFLRYRSIPSELRAQVHAYYGHLWESRMGQDEASILGDLPESLRVDLALAMRRDLIHKVPFFREAHEELLKDVVMALRPVVYPPGAYLIREGEAGDCMFIVSSGTVEVVSRDGSQVFAEFNEGSFVGELSLVYQSPRTASARALGYCDLYILTKQSFDFILQKHPAFAEHVMEIAAQRKREVDARSN